MKSVHPLAWIKIGAAMVVAGLMSCQPPAKPPQDDLPVFFARTIATGDDIVGDRDRIIIHSKASNENDLYFGVSQKRADMKDCWIYQQKILTECKESDIERVYLTQTETSSIPIFFFAIATKTDKEVLVIMDYRTNDPQDSVDGFRYVLLFENGEWHVKSLTQVY